MNYDYSPSELIDRGKYLTEYIDTLPNKANKSDISKLPKGNIIVNWGPASGKTTALRQFIVDNINSTGIIATKLVEDVRSIRYDIIAQSYYINPRQDIELLKSKIVEFHSGVEIDPDDLKLSNWIICTHERLLIEPPSLIYTRDLSTVVSPINTEDLYRKYLFIDEYPANIYKEFPINKIYSAIMINYLIGINDNEISSFDSDIARAQYINKLYNKSITDPIIIGILDSLPTPTNQSYLLDIKRGNNSIMSKYSKERIIFFTNLINKKYSEYRLTNISDESSYYDSLYYTIKDFQIPNKYIFDGTGDLLLKDSKYWTILSNNKFPRNLKLKSNIRLINTYTDRNDSVEYISQEYSDVITQIANIHPDSKLIIYTWKDSYSDSAKLDKAIISKLDSDIANRSYLIHYMSGQERVTSEYSDSDVVIILGKFFIPKSTVNLMNIINESSISVEDYTISLLIQLIYRSSARHDNPISLYITNDYPDSVIKSLLNSYNLTIENNSSSSLIDYWLIEPKSIHPERRSSELLEIINSDKLIDNTSEYVLIDSTSLRSVLNMSGKSDNYKIMNKLRSLGISFSISSYGTDKGGRGKSSIYKIWK